MFAKRLSPIALSLLITLGVLSACTDPQVSSPTPKVAGSDIATDWASQLAIAQDAIHKVNPDVVLTFMRVNPAVIVDPDTPVIVTSTQPLDLQFIFVPNTVNQETVTAGGMDPNSSPELRVSFQDTAVSSTLKVDSPYDFVSPAPSAEDKAGYQAALSHIRMSPEQALQSTFNEGRQYSQDKGAKTEPLLHLSLGRDVPERFAVPAVWQILYLVVDADSLYFVIDAETGRILEKAYRP